ncbi:deoxyribodipyrimidine photo-lyase [Dyadobacter aurulentus]|uniref:deoxyribodipyrimidine photo-lyase n=1 Tax=Dyadobacter sp. UC 10 TaxID=2605428 RepID=UPI0011F339EB|nr:deoxyribodipyrimidine photo-lyase [Dyadobacter sp. UC 10]KAA0991048.1 cryptochrome DASH [Dyadobacter sp. UC 10]
MADRIVYWFRNDLRLLDNEALFSACNSSKEIIPVFVFDPRQFENTRLGFRRTNALRAQQLINCVTDLRNTIRQKGGDLIIKIGEPEKIIAQLAEDQDAGYVYCSKEIAPEETRIESSLSKNLKTGNIDIKLFWMDTLVHAAELPFPISKLPGSFDAFAKAMENKLNIATSLPEPSAIRLPEGLEPGQMPALTDLGFRPESATQQNGTNEPIGQDEAIKSLFTYLSATSDPEGFHTLIDSGISRWLSMGCLSPRYVYETVMEMDDSAKRQSLLRELLERDYYHWTLLRFGPRIFKPSGVKHHFTKRWANDHAAFKTWTDSKTENTEINLIMQKLKSQGDLAASERMTAAEYLANVLDINWTWGAMYFESNLKDYEPSVSWGKWNRVAGVGVD